MTTIKSYTDIEQSRILADILPHESADMFYSDIFIDEKHKYNPHYLETYGFKTFEDTKQKESKYLSFLPCWSLAALLGVLPNKLQIVLAINDFQGNRKEKYAIGSVEHDKYDCFADNPIDACMAMIKRLHELNLL